MLRQWAELELAAERSNADRAALIARYLVTVEVIGRMVDQLGELHTELNPDDRLQQALGSLAFLWGYVEDELRAAAGLRRN